MQLKAIADSLLFRVLLALGVGFLLAPYLPHGAIVFFYSVSCAIKDLLVFFLPVVIVSYLVSSIISYEDGAPKIIVGILGGMVLSIFCALAYAYGIGVYALPHIVHAAPVVASTAQEEISPLFTLPLKHVPADLAMMFAFVVAFWLNVLQSSFVRRLRNSYYNKLEKCPPSGDFCFFLGLVSCGIFARAEHLAKVKRGFFALRSGCERALLQLFIPIVPVYIFGFILKISIESSSLHFLQSFGRIFVCSFVAIMGFVFLAYLIAARGSPRRAFSYLRTMLPAVVTGFSTMSSVATMPLTIQATENNLGGNEDFVKFVIPTTVNVHAVGDVINIAFAGLALVLMGGGVVPGVAVYALFAVYTCLAQFSCVSVPGGGIIIMTGILQHYLGLSAEATTLLTSIYFLQEPFLTACNVAYNGAFAIFLKKMLRI